MKNFRQNPPKELAGSPVAIIKDYQTLKQTIVKTGEIKDLDFPCTSNVIQYFTEDGSKVSVRPSGTEPKIKFYVEVSCEMDCICNYNKVEQQATEKIDAVRKSLGV